MKTIIKSMNMFALALVFAFPFFVSADSSIYGGYDYDYSYGGGYDYGSSYGGYDYNYDTSYGGYDYDYNYGGYDYDYDSSYGGYDYDYNYGGYDYDTSYGGYDYDYNYGGYDYDTSYGGYDYDYNYGGYDYDYNYGGYDYDVTYGGYDYDYNYGGYDYDYNYGGYDYDSSYGGYDYDVTYGGYDYDYNYGGYDYDTSYGGYDYDYNNNQNDDYDYDWYPQYGNNDYNYYDTGYNDDYDDYDYNPGCRTNCYPQQPNPPVRPNPPVVVQPLPLDAICVPSFTSIREGESVTFTADVAGGTTPYTYRWVGDVTSNNRTVTKTFNHAGTYIAQFIVTDSRGRTASDECEVRVREVVVTPSPALDAICIPSITSIREGESVTFTADVAGGTAPYSYRWTGDVSSNIRTVTKTFNQAGTFVARFTVTDSRGQTASDECEVRVREVVVTPPQTLDAICIPSITSIREGESVTFTADVAGGTTPYTYQWTGDASSTNRSFNKVFNQSGTYYVNLRVTDSAGRTAYDECEVRVREVITPPQTLDAICIPSFTSIREGESVTFTADVAGGTTPYTYRWSGDATSTNRSFSKVFNQSGTYYVNLRVTDSAGRTATDECEVRVREEVQNDDLDAICVPSFTTVREGERVTFSARVDGGTRPYEYRWTGDDVNEDDEQIRVRFDDTGRYTINLRVTDDRGRTATDECEVRVIDKDRDRDDDRDRDRDVNVTTGTITNPPVRGNLASVGSVYLNQVPYTGPEEVAKGIAFVSSLLAFSIGAAMIVRRKKNQSLVSDRIAAFKAANQGIQR